MMQKQTLPRRQLIALALLASTVLSAPSVIAQTSPQPVVAVNSLPIDEPTSYEFNASVWRGPVFQTGNLPSQIQEVAFGFDLDGIPTTATLHLYQLDSTTDFPSGAALGSATISMVGTGAQTDVHTYSASQLGSIATTTLQAGQKYAVILSNPSDIVALTNDDLTQNNYTFAGGFGPVGIGYVKSLNAGIAWEQENGTPAFRLTVLPIEDSTEIDPTNPDPRPEPDPDPTPGTPARVPTLGTWGLLSMASVMGLVGMRRARRPRP